MPEEDKPLTCVYLDDERTTPDGWERVYTAAEAIKRLEAQDVDIMSLDHDLSWLHYGRDYSDGQTGYDVLLWLVERVGNDPSFRVPELRVHSFNSDRVPKMLGVIRRIEKIKAVAGEAD